MSDGKQEDAKTSAGRSLAFIGLETVSEPGPVPNNTTDKWPRRLLAEDGHYQVHKVARVELRKGILSFTFVHEDGKEYHGPFYWDTINGERPEAALMLERNGLRDILRVRFVIAWHSGVFPNGHPARLLREYPCEESERFAATIREDNARERERLREELLRHPEWLEKEG